MTLAAIFEVAIMLTLTYLMLALMGSALQELLAGALKWRAKHLARALKRLICDGTEPGSSAESLLAKLREHALICTYGEEDLPSYIPSRNFSTALIYLLSEGSQAPIVTALNQSVTKLPDSPVKQSMIVFMSRCGGDLDKLDASIQTWFDDAMDQLSGDYKRWSQRFMLFFGLIVAVGLNADSLRMARVLRTEPPEVRAAQIEDINKMRGHLASEAAISDQAARTAEQARAAVNPAAPPQPPLAPVLHSIELADDLDSLRLPIGWFGVAHEFAGQSPAQKAMICVRMLIGWTMTALAVSLGAPFWFDTLNRLFNLRAAGPKPPKSSTGDDATTTQK